MIIKKFIRLTLLAVTALFIASCASNVPVTVQQSHPPIACGPRQDIVHIVAPGETLWRVGKMYGVSGADIARANNLTTQNPVLKKGSRLTIPNAAPVAPVVSLYPSNKWKYIIIHHSGSEMGDSLSFDKYHLSKGWLNGVGYHFVIDNGTDSRCDGQIEVSPRWLKQLNGSHCKADHMNERAIGICLVGNFNRDHLSSRQLESLTYLVKTLKTYYRIPDDHIMGHGQVPGARTDCPGKHFPWAEFKARLARARG